MGSSNVEEFVHVRMQKRYFYDILYDIFAFGGSQSWASLIGQDGSFLPALNSHKIKCVDVR